ncbi:MAG TPA: hypothetical protein PLL26_07570 [Candidatus Dojkabacteria bacterium]|nr:hypothetical protein [Candidatus Dojkabacteria bacterium]
MSNQQFLRKSKKGKDIEQISRFYMQGEEREVLFNVGSKFKITKIMKDDMLDVINIELEEVL